MGERRREPPEKQREDNKEAPESKHRQPEQAQCGLEKNLERAFNVAAAKKNLEAVSKTVV